MDAGATLRARPGCSPWDSCHDGWPLQRDVGDYHAPARAPVLAKTLNGMGGPVCPHDFSGHFEGRPKGWSFGLE